MCCQTCRNLCPMQRKRKQNKDGLSRNQSSTMPENWTKRWRIQAHNQSRSEKVGSSDASSNALQNTDKEQWEHPPQYWETQDKYACIVDADESTRPRLEGAVHKHHQDHIIAKRVNSMTRDSLVHKFIPMPQVLKNSRCKGGSGKELEKLEKIPAWDLTKVINKKEVIDEARNKERKVHFASLMDICHLKNSELEPQYHEYKGRVLLWGLLPWYKTSPFSGYYTRVKPKLHRRRRRIYESF